MVACLQLQFGLPQGLSCCRVSQLNSCSMVDAGGNPGSLYCVRFASSNLNHSSVSLIFRMQFDILLFSDLLTPVSYLAMKWVKVFFWSSLNHKFALFQFILVQNIKIIIFILKWRTFVSHLGIKIK